MVRLGAGTGARSTSWCSAAAWPACPPPSAWPPPWPRPTGRASGPASGGLRVGVLTKAELSQSATRWAQGGVAAVLGGDEDSTDLHLADTLAAGAGLCDADAVRVLVDEGPSRVHELIAMGAVFDRQPGRRPGPGPRGRATPRPGWSTPAGRPPAPRSSGPWSMPPGPRPPPSWRSGSPSTCVVEGGRCRGVTGPQHRRAAGRGPGRHTVLATGGAGQVFAVTTNPAEATGDGLAMALRAGVPVADVEFMQFHPTALHHPAMPRPLLSEALRGHGALLRDAQGERFVDELAPRDVVSRAMAERMRDQGVESLWLDATGLDSFDARFPTISASLAAIGLDPSPRLAAHRPGRPLPVRRGVTDLSGATALPGLWAAGEVACTGVHGANRLASNSLLEGMVFGARLAETILAGEDGPTPTGVLAALDPRRPREAGGPGRGGPVDRRPRTGQPPAEAGTWPDVAKTRERLQRAMTEGAGVVRSARLAGLGRRHRRRPWPRSWATPTPADRAHGELANLVTAARSLLRSATVRHETRGRPRPERLPGGVRRLALPHRPRSPTGWRSVPDGPTAVGPRCAGDGRLSRERCRAPVVDRSGRTDGRPAPGAPWSTP